MEKIEKQDYIFKMENKKLFKALCSKSGLNMSEVLNDLIKKTIKLDIYEIGK